MKRYARLFVVISILSIGFFSIFLYHLQAQQANNGLQVHPSNFDLDLTPGVKLQKTITIDNMSNKDFSVVAKAENFSAQGEQGGVSFSTEDTTYSLAKWISITPTTAISIPARTSKTVTYTITPPVNAEPGGHFGSIIIATVPDPAHQGVGAAVSERVASLILARVPGNAAESANVETFTTDKSFYEFGPVAFDLRVKNTGAVHIIPAGVIEITNMFGKKTDLPLDGRTVLPNSVRKMPTVWKNHLLIGKYTAILIAAYGSKNEQITSGTEFYAFPIRYGLIGLGILILLFLIRKRLGKAIRAIITGK